MSAEQVESVVDLFNVCNSLFVSSSLLEIASMNMTFAVGNMDITVVEMCTS